MSDAYDRMKRLRERDAHDATAEETRKREEAAARAHRAERRLRDLRDILVAEGVTPQPLYQRTVDWGHNYRRSFLGNYPDDVHTYADTGEGGWLLARTQFSGDEDMEGSPVSWPILTTQAQVWAGSATKKRTKRDEYGRGGIKVRGLDRGPGLGGSPATRPVVYMADVHRPALIGDLSEDTLTAWYLQVVTTARR